jgi:hypothetical protein
MDLNDLPKFSPWPARLLGLEKFSPKHKTPSEIEREYGVEKWGSFLTKVKRSHLKISTHEVDGWLMGERQKTLCMVDGKFKVLQTLKAHKLYLNLIAKSLCPYRKASALVELGCGYGSILLNLAKRREFKHLPLFGGDYTKSGVELIQKLAFNQSASITAFRCDFNSSKIFDQEIPKHSIIFTSFGISCVPKLSDQFIQRILSKDPLVVAFFEPCYEHAAGDSLLELFRRKYIELNDYNRNFLTLLRKSKVHIIAEKKPNFGLNPLFAPSIILWKRKL